MKKNLFKYFSLLSLIIFTPSFAFAQNIGLTDVVLRIRDLFGAILPVLISLGVIYFVWGVVQYMIGDSEEAKKKGRNTIIFCIIGLAVIVSLWGIVYLVVDTFGLGGSSAPIPAPLTGEEALCDLSGDPKFQDLLCYVTRIINDAIIPLIFALAVVFFVWGAVKFFIINADEEAKRAQGKQFMIWGIIALAVMVSILGLVSILSNTFNINSSVLPQVKPPGSSPQPSGPCPGGGYNCE